MVSGLNIEVVTCDRPGYVCDMLGQFVLRERDEVSIEC